MVIMNLLTPADYGLIGILSVFVSVSLIFSDSGFSQALIRKRSVGPEDYSSVFVFNMLAAVALYALLAGLSPWIARFFEAPAISRVGPVLFLLVPLSALCNIQNTILVRCMDFKSISKYTLWGSLVSSAAAVAIALAGFGVWALVWQRLLTVGVKGVLLWTRSRWHPTADISATPLRSMWGYSSRLLLSDLANTVYNNISQLFIGKMYSKTELGYYEQGRKLKEMPVTSVILSVQGVTFPALSKVQDDAWKFSEGARKVMVVMSFVMFPLMVGLIAVAPDMFRALLPERWMPTVPYFRILCIAGLFAPISVISYNILKIKSDGKVIFRLELLKKAIATVVLAATIPVSVEAIAWGITAIAGSDAVINALAARRYADWKLGGLLKRTAPYAALASAMWLGIWGASFLLPLIGALGALGAEVTVGAAVYLLLSRIFRVEGWYEVYDILKMLAAGKMPVTAVPPDSDGF